MADAAQSPPVVAGRRPAIWRPGLLTMEDIEQYEAIEREPTHTRYRGLDVYGMAPPSSGGSTVGEALNIIEGVPGFGSLSRTQQYHWFLEASRFAFADRNRYVGDPAYVDVPLAGLLSQSFADERRALIDPAQASASPVAPGDPTDNGGATLARTARPAAVRTTSRCARRRTSPSPTPRARSSPTRSRSSRPAATASSSRAGASSSTTS